MSRTLPGMESGSFFSGCPPPAAEPALLLPLRSIGPLLLSEEAGVVAVGEAVVMMTVTVVVTAAAVFAVELFSSMDGRLLLFLALLGGQVGALQVLEHVAEEVTKTAAVAMVAMGVAEPMVAVAAVVIGVTGLGFGSRVLRVGGVGVGGRGGGSGGGGGGIILASHS